MLKMIIKAFGILLFLVAIYCLSYFLASQLHIQHQTLGLATLTTCRGDIYLFKIISGFLFIVFLIWSGVRKKSS